MPAQPKIEILCDRGPETETYITVFVNGEHFSEAVIRHVDPGKGHTAEDWEESIKEIEQENYTPAFRDSVIDAMQEYSDSEWID
jgi:hypothetical protein